MTRISKNTVAIARLGTTMDPAPMTFVIAPDADMVAVMPVVAVHVTPVAPPRALKTFQFVPSFVAVSGEQLP